MISWRLNRNHLLDLRLALGMLLPITAGLAIFGWRAAGTIFLVCAGAVAARFMLARLQSWPVATSRCSTITQAMIIAMFLPATWFDVDRALLSTNANWPLAIATGVILSLLNWFISRVGTARLSPVVITLLIVISLSAGDLFNNRVLSPRDLFKGDLLNDNTALRSTSTAEPWLAEKFDAPVLITLPASKGVDDYLRARIAPDRPAITIARLVSDDLPPLEDLVVLGHPRSIGNASALAVIVGGLFLVHRRMVAFRMPATMIISAFAMLLILPMPVIVSSDEIVRSWIMATDKRVGWAIATTFANYIVVASPLFLVVFFIANQPGIRPLSGRAGVVWSILFGTLSATLMAMVSMPFGPIIAVAVAQFITPTLDRYLPSKPTL